MRQQPQADGPGRPQLPLGHEHLPDGGSWNNRVYQDQPTTYAPWTCWSAQGLLLPYTEQTPLYNAINFNFAPEQTDHDSNPANSTVNQIVIASFLCPSDPNGGRRTTNSYSGSVGSSTAVGGYQGFTNGLFGSRYGASIAEIIDGTSGTMMFAEHLTGDGRGFGRNGNGNSNPSRYRGNGVVGAGGADANNRYRDQGSTTVDPATGQIILQPNVQAALDSCLSVWNTAGGTDKIVDHRGWRWTMGITGYTMFNTVQTPNPPFNYCRLACNAFCNMDNSTSQPASSQHPGGVNVCMADGSVKFIKDTIARQVWWGLGSKDGGEVISADNY